MDFRRGWFFQKARDIAPVRYKNAMMEQTSADFNTPGPNDNTIEDPALADDAKYPLRTVDIFGLPKHDVREVKVQPGSVIYTKSGGIHGIRNPHGTQPLRFVAFGYHSS
jgi:hypothetical protein